MSMVSSEFGIGALEGRVAVGFGFLDPVIREEAVSTAEGSSKPDLVGGCEWKREECLLTHSGAPSCSGCAVTNSSTLEGSCHQSRSRL